MNNIVICVDTDEDCARTLERLPAKFDLTKAKVHLIHVFEIHVSNMEFTPVIYPSQDQYPEIEKNILEYLAEISKKLKLNVESVHRECFFSYSKERSLKEYLVKVNADTVILASKGKHGIADFFSSSLADYLCKDSPCDIIILRPEQSSDK